MNKVKFAPLLSVALFLLASCGQHGLFLDEVFSSSSHYSSSSLRPSSSSSSLYSSSSLRSSSSSSSHYSSSSLRPSSSSSSLAAGQFRCTGADNTETQYCSKGEMWLLDDEMRDYGFVQDASGQTYKTVLIGEQTWMAENLNYYVRNSYCFGNRELNCEKYGRLYDWSATMAIPNKCNSVAYDSDDSDCIRNTPHHQGICPDGWHIPSYAEWAELLSFVSGESNSSSAFSQTAGKLLKAIRGWEEWKSNGTDAFGFAALPGGYGDPKDDYFNNSGFDGGTWWVNSGSNRYDYASHDNYVYINSRTDVGRSGIGKRELLRSVRCMED